ncbi:MAG TPA: aminotransferase class I/II-fold pyridoxal phosphate-dependent enzyme [Symbiobacteriaceae bacterium]|nr:aminotransferase class I/II-fold pyridoxal phosphate-dependent enzyme [Symbiobacteriaceae bacterium]
MKQRFATVTVHAGQRPDPVTGSLSTPIYQTSTFVFPDVATGARRFAGEEAGYIYTRLGNPTQAALEEKIAALEGAEAALAFGSGMAAISAVLLGLLRSGDHLLYGDSIYGCSHSLINELLPRWGITATAVDGTDLVAVAQAIQPNTKVFLLETPSNPTLKVVDIAAIAALCAPNAIQLVVDNTFASPALQLPLKLGAHVVVHSATKFIGGHGDVIAGVAAGPKALMDELRMTTLKDIGGVIAPFDAWLLLRGLKTLDVRVQRHCANAMQVAAFLDQHPMVERVYYPGLPHHPQYEIAQRQMSAPGSLISFEVRGGLEAGRRFIERLELCQLAVSLGDVDTLIQHPASMTHSIVPREERMATGITDGLIRLAVGIEDAADIIEDLAQGLAYVGSMPNLSAVR